jgi:hypothetical protein
MLRLSGYAWQAKKKYVLTSKYEIIQDAKHALRSSKNEAGLRLSTSTP